MGNTAGLRRGLPVLDMGHSIRVPVGRTFTALADRHVNLELRTDPNLAAGLRVRLGDMVVDNSVAGDSQSVRAAAGLGRCGALDALPTHGISHSERRPADRGIDAGGPGSPSPCDHAGDARVGCRGRADRPAVKLTTPIRLWGHVGLVRATNLDLITDPADDRPRLVR